jgi:hypothetical protein
MHVWIQRAIHELVVDQSRYNSDCAREWNKRHGREEYESIPKYYLYLNLLSIPNHDYELNDEVISCIFSFLPHYALSPAKCVSKRWSMIITPIPEVITYHEEAVREMNWYHMANICHGNRKMTKEIAREMINIAASEGYRFVVRGYV